MPEPRVDFKIGVDFEDIDAQIATKAGQLGNAFSQAFTVRALPAAQQVTQSIQQAGAATDNARERLRDYGAAGSVLTGIWAGWQLVRGAVLGVASSTLAVGRALLDAQIFAQKFAITMQLATGDDASNQMNFVRQAANRLGLELQTTAHFYSLFIAASRGTRIEGEQAREIFNQVAAASAVMGLSALDVEGVFRALTQMISKGTVQAEEMRGQLGERLPGAFQIAARALGVTTREFSKMLEQGEVISTEFLPKFARQLKEEFSGSVERASQRTEASLNRLSTAWLDFRTAIAEAGIAAVIVRDLDGITGALNRVSTAVREAKEDGAGTFRQWIEGAGALADTLLNRAGGFFRFFNFISSVAQSAIDPVRALAQSSDDASVKLEKARARLDQVRASLTGNTNPILIQERNDLQALIDKLESAQIKADQLRGRFSTSPGHRIDAAIDAESFGRANKAMSDLQKVMIAVSGVSGEFESGTARVNDALAAGAIDAQTASIMQGLLAAKYTDAGKAAAAAAEASMRYRRELDDKIGSLAESVNATDKLTRGEKLLNDLERDLASGKARLGRADADLRREKLATLIATEKQTAATKLAEKAEAELLKLDEASLQTETKRLQSITEAIRKQQDENAALGLSKDALAQYNIGKQETILLDLQRKALIPELSTAELGAINAQITAQQRLIELAREGAAKRAVVDAAEEAEKAWKKTAETIESSLTDALLRGFESGKSIFQNLRDAAVNLFKTLVLRPIIQPVASSLAGGALSLLGLAPGAANAAGGGASNIGSLLSGAGGLAGSIGAFGSFASTGLASTLTGTSLGTTLGAAGSLLEGGSIAGGLGLGAGAIAPYALAAFAAVQVLSKLLKKPKPAEQNFSFLDQFGAAAGNPFPTPNLKGQGTFDDVLRPLISSVGQFAQALGGAAGDLRFGLFTSASPDGKGAQVVSQVSGPGGDLFRLDTQGTNESVQSRIEATLPALLLAGLQGAQLPQVFADFFKSIDVTGATQEQVNAAIATANAAKSMADAVANVGGVFAQVGGLSVDARANILQLAGGLDAFNSKVSGFVQSFFSQQEQSAIQAASIATTLRSAGVDISGLDTRAEFRTLVDSLNLQSDTGQEQLAALLNVAQGFAGLTDFLSISQLTLEQLAAQAPQSELIESLTTGQDASTTAITTSLGTVNATLVQRLDAVVGAIDGLKEDLRIANAAVAANTNKTAQVLDRWTVEGLPATAV